MTTTTTTVPAIWIGDLAAYNAGILHGAWIKLDDDPSIEELQAAVNDILDEGTRRYSDETLSVHEEFGIFDYEGFGSIRLDESTPLQTVLEHVERMGDDPDRYFAFVSVHGVDYAEQYSPDWVFGPYECEEDFAWEFLENTLGTTDLSAWLIEKGLPAGLTGGIRFDAERLNREFRFSGAMSFTRMNGKVYAVENR